MSSSAQIIFRDVGLVIHAPGLMALASLPICLWFDERYAVWPFVWTALASLSLGQGLYRLFCRAGETRLHHAMLSAALGWVVVPVLGIIPFMAIALQGTQLPNPSPTVLAFQQPWNALFESFSGFTDTGLSVAVSPSQLPYSLQWWRSFTEWVGGVGVIVLMLSILRPGAGMHQLYYSEGREEKILPSVRATVRAIWWIYLLYTLLSVLLLGLVGMPWWPAINYGLTSLATGGFSITDHSIGEYGLGVRLAVMLIMLVGATSFAVHYQVLRRRHWQVLWQDEQHQALWWMVGLGSLVLLIENYWSQGSLMWIDTFFQWISALSTTGLQTVDLQLWSPTGQLLLSFAMLVGGAAGSTAGGLKQIRVVFLAKGVVWRLRQIMLQPHAVMRYEVNREGLSESEATRLVEAAGILATLWAVLFWGGVCVLLHVVPERFTVSDVIFEVASAQGNVGLSIGITHPDLAWVGKLVLILEMWMGRLEILPVLILFAPLFGSRKK